MCAVRSGVHSTSECSFLSQSQSNVCRHNLLQADGKSTELARISTEKGSDESFLDSQPWVSTQGTLSFVDETRDTIAIYDTSTGNNVFTNRSTGDVHVETPRSLIRPDSSHAPDQEFHQAVNQEDYLFAGSLGQCSTDQTVRTRDVNLENDISREALSGESPSLLGVGSYPEHVPVEFHAFEGAHESRSPKRRRVTNDVSSQCNVTPASGGLESPSSIPGFGDYASPAHSLLLRPSVEVGVPTAKPIGIRRETFSSTYSFGTPIPYPDAKAGLLTDPHEARLLRHFVEKLAISFDLTDPLCHFRNVVPQRAMNDPILLNAILAASARHLSRISGGDPYIADKYHQECIQHLIPMLNDETAVLDENLLASTVILRYLEEIDVPISGKLHPDGAGHLIGTHVFISAQEISAVFGGLRLAAFWVGLRQEIYVAFVNQRSIIPPLQHCNVDRSFEPADEGTWANRIIVHCAETIRWCFGLHEHERSPAQFAELLQYSEDWLKFTPPCYNPIYYRDADADSDAVFPEVMYLSDATVTGIQHYHLTLILLRAHDPNIPNLGPRRTAALRKMDNEIKHHIKMLCGLALSNNSTPPNFVTASMAVAMAGDKFTEIKEQEACIRILQTCEVDHGWPTTTAQEDLKEAWGWR